MEFDIQIEADFIDKISPLSIEQALKTTLRRREITATTLSVIITDTETVRQLNQQYRGIDAPTDVLSFGNTPDPDFPTAAPFMEPHLGDLIIAYPVAEAQAQTAGHPPAAEVVLLTVHGTLHLLGFDHDTPERRTEMWRVQQEIMIDLNLGHIQPTET